MTKDADKNKKHYHGHRGRLMKRALENGFDSLQNYELVEMLLHYAIPQRDTKELAKTLLADTGKQSLYKLFHADVDALARTGGIAQRSAALFALVRHLKEKMEREEIKQSGTVLSSWQAVAEYCRSKIGFSGRENFAVLLLNSKNKLLHDKILAEGTLNKVVAYPREIASLALKHDAAAVILVHNHPSGDTTPSKQDIEMTKTIKQALHGVEVALHDHLIVSPQGETSFKSLGLLD